MITDRIGRHAVLLPINRNFNKICDILGSFFLIKTQEIPIFFSSSEKKKLFNTRWYVLSNYLGMTCTVLFNCPIKAEFRAVDSQSDLRILL